MMGGMPTARQRLDELNQAMMHGAIDDATARTRRAEIESDAQRELAYEEAVFAVLRAGESIDHQRARLEQVRRELGLPLTQAAEVEAHCLRVHQQMQPRTARTADGSPSGYLEPPSLARIIYGLSIGAGAGMATYLYGFAFDQLSEAKLMRLTPVWMFFLVFGFYGLIAHSLWRAVARGQVTSPAEGVLRWTRPVGALGLPMLIMVFPFLVVRSRNSVVTALVGSLIWAVLLGIFFVGLWPHL